MCCKDMFLKKEGYELRREREMMSEIIIKKKPSQDRMQDYFIALEQRLQSGVNSVPRKQCWLRRIIEKRHED